MIVCENCNRTIYYLSPPQELCIDCSNVKAIEDLEKLLDEMQQPKDWPYVMGSVINDLGVANSVIAIAKTAVEYSKANEAIEILQNLKILIDSIIVELSGWE